MNEQVQAKVNKARNILRALDDNVSIAIAANAMFNAAAYDDAITKRFDQTVEAWGFNEILSSEQLNLIMSLNRIYDKRDDVDSIPRLMEIIADLEVKTTFRDDAASRASEHEPHFISPISEEDRRWLIEDSRNNRRVNNIQNFEIWDHQAREIFNELRGWHILDRLRKFRNQVLAHTAPTDEVKSLPKNDFAEKLLIRTIDLMTVLQLALNGFHLNYGGSMEVWNQKAAAFWKAAARGRNPV